MSLLKYSLERSEDPISGGKLRDENPSYQETGHMKGGDAKKRKKQASTNKNEKQISKIIGVQFSILSPEEIRRNSVVEVSKRDTYINNKPVIGGLFDPRMGVLEPGIICPTDGLTYIDTPGYFGHIELARPVFFIQHLKEIMKICRCVCFKCSRLLLNKNQHKHILEKTSEERWDYVSVNAPKIKRCGDVTEDGCGCRQPSKIKVEGMAMLHAFWENFNEEENIKIRLTPELVLKIFKRISDEDVNFMGFSSIWSRPDWMICQVLPVPPPAVRPSVKHDAQQRSEDDLTHIYSNIIKTNEDLKKKMAMEKQSDGNMANVQTAPRSRGRASSNIQRGNIGANNYAEGGAGGKPNSISNAIEGMTSLLQYFIAMIVNNKVKGAEPLAQRSGRPLQCIMGRLNSKNGRIRGNLMGKRVDFSARSVITGDPNLSIKQLGVPMKIAMNITKPVIVNDLNRDFLLKLIQNGPDVHPGAKILERRNGENISLRYVDRNSIRLENGDKVHRHMIDGDAVLFNRQPSLHRMSMMAHIVKIMKKGDTFRINVSDCAPYNGDFDGDEMNMHMPQNLLAETELRHLAAIPYQIVSPTNNTPIIKIVQDTLLGSYRFTRPNIKLSPRHAMNLLMGYKNVNVNAIREKASTLSSFDVLSQIMPPLTLMYKTKLFEEGEDFETSNNVLEIRNGKYVRGQIDKSVFAGGTKGIIHRTFNDFGNEAAVEIIDNVQSVITEYMKTSSFSVGISDLISDRKTSSEITQIILSKKIEVQSVIDQLHLGIFKNTTANTNQMEFETRVKNILNDATKESGNKSRKSLNKNNRFLMIVNSGSKGDIINISQMISCLGQQNVDGKRVPYGFNNRTLPHYSKFDDSPNARGFIDNSYINGLTASELFFHAMAGRIGLIDTAVKTSTTGYIQRRLIKGLEDIKVEYDMTVRNSKGKIIQYRYGDDGFDSTKTESQIVPLVEMSIEDIYTHYDILGLNDYDKDLLVVYTKGTVSRMKRQKVESKNKCLSYIEKMIENRDKLVSHVFKDKNENNVVVPVSFHHIIVNTQGQLELNSNSIVDITPLEAFELIEEYFDKLTKISYSQPTVLFETLYYFFLSPRDLLIKKRFHRKGLVLLLENILLKYKKSIVHPGEMVGIISGQSIGEPSTQLTLNTFHGSGIASKSNVTRGVPRIEELLRLTKNPKNPSLTIQLRTVDQTNKERASYYAKMIEYTKLIDLVSSFKVCFDPIDDKTFIEEDVELLNQFKTFEKMVEECNDSEESNNGSSHQEPEKSKWIVRLELNPELLLNKNITMDDIHFAIKHGHYGDNISCVYSDYNSDKLVFRIRPNSNIFSKNNRRRGQADSLDQMDDIYLIKNFQDNLLNNTILKGINGITNVIPRKNQNTVVKEDGKFVKKDVWVLDTTGSNLLDTLALDFIDYRKTWSNDVREVFDVLGIEAANRVLFNEMTEVMEYSGVYINYHHLSLLCDRMTCNKNMVEIFRSGILNDNIGPISKSTFEVHTEVLLQAARHSEFDEVNSVSSSVLLGQHGNFGTNLFNIVMDMDAIHNMETSGELSTSNYSQQNAEIEDMFYLSNAAKENDMCSKSKIEINNHIQNIHLTLDPSVSGSIDENKYEYDDDYDLGF
jgi:DNA-directed RNA polymerase II subunit RPB1